MAVSASVLLQGGWYAIEQCGRLLQDAVTLHRARAYPSAVALALIAREELGRYIILRDFWRKVAEDGSLPTVEAVLAACDDHVEKQRQGQLSLTFRADSPGGGLARIVSAYIHNPPGSPEWKEAKAQLDTLLAKLQRRAPTDRHSTRMRALYVDLNESGTGWSRPCELTEGEAMNCLLDAVNDYALQVNNHLQPEILKSVDPALAAALDAWPERPPLPPAVWPFDT
jgi:AbiV family abortive infection protein